MNDKQLVNILKGLVIDGVHKAKSGHPGGAMSSMDFAYLLYSEFLNFDPENPKWLGRDRFILSAGHESMLQYALLKGIGWLETSDLESFRQLHSKTPGHPENFVTPGVECTTGPLGQGCAMSVGFAIASSHISAKLKSKLFSNKTWVLLGDGCMQEGVTLASASLAGHLKLNHLVWYYDKNDQQISGCISRATSDDPKKIFEGLGWQVREIDGHNHQQIRDAIKWAKDSPEKPSLIIGQSTMAKGASSMEGDHNSHGAPLPDVERIKTKKQFGIPEGEDFYWSDEAKSHFTRNFPKLQDQVKSWQQSLKNQMQDSAFSKLYHCYFESEKSFSLQTPNWDQQKPIATRNAFGDLLEAWADAVPQLVGGSADLEPSNMTGAFAKKVGDYSAQTPQGRNLAFGVREFPMSAICNGISLYGGLIPFDATFLSFADYSKAALRLGCIQKVPVIHEFTHDSFYLGEDGPTHQPIEHIMSLRLTPEMYVMRPADANETAQLLALAISSNKQSSFCLTRQKLAFLPAGLDHSQAKHGAWEVMTAKDPDLVILATGSEVQLALEVASELKQSATFKEVKVVSMPCWELFEEQDQSYKNTVMAWKCQKRVSIEAGSTLGWQKYVGTKGLTIGIDHYGASAPAKELESEFGFTKKSVINRINEHQWA